MYNLQQDRYYEAAPVRPVNRLYQEVVVENYATGTGKRGKITAHLPNGMVKVRLKNGQFEVVDLQDCRSLI